MMVSTTDSIAFFSSYDTLETWEPLWNQLIQKASSEWIIFSVWTLIVTEIVFFGAWLPYLIMDFFPIFFKKYKIQQDKINTWQDYKKCLTLILFNHLFIHASMAFSSGYLFTWLGYQTNAPLPKPSRILFECVLHFLVEDFCFYWVHRFLHWKKIYKYVHKVHHEFQAPFGIAAEYTHPVEVLITNTATFIGPIFFSRHILTLWIWLTLRLIETVDGHSGYEFPFSLGNLIPFWSGNAHHDYHHQKFDCNFGSIFSFWDWICGTDTKFRTLNRKKKSKGQHAWSDLFEKIHWISLLMKNKQKQS